MISETSILQLILKKSLKLEDEERCKGQGILTIGFDPVELEQVQKAIKQLDVLNGIQEVEIEDLKNRLNTCKMSMALKDNEINELEEKYYNDRYNLNEDWDYVSESINKEVVENDDGFKEVHLTFDMEPYSYPVKYIITPKKYYFAQCSGNFDDNGQHIYTKKEVKNIYQSKCGGYLAHDVEDPQDEETLLEYDDLIN